MFNANYLAYADEAVEHVLRQQGVAYTELLSRGLDTSVVASELAWSSPARWGEVVQVDGVVERVGRTSFVVALTISVGDRLCCRVRTTYVLTDDERKPTPIPDDVRARWSEASSLSP